MLETELPEMPFFAGWGLCEQFHYYDGSLMDPVK